MPSESGQCTQATEFLMATATAPVTIRRGEAYSLSQLKAFGLGTAALRTARRRGLLVRRIGRRSVVLGEDLLAYIRTLPAVDPLCTSASE